jgi:hypothetical protein
MLHLEQYCKNSAGLTVIWQTFLEIYNNSQIETGIIIKSIISRTPDIDVDYSFLQESYNLESYKLMFK